MAKNQTKKTKKDSKKQTEAVPEEIREAALKTSKPKQAKPPATDEEQDITETKDFAKFIRTQQAVDKLSEDFDIDEISDAEKRDIITNYNAWVKQGRPKPQMPKPKTDDEEKILRVYRRRSFDSEWLTMVTLGQAVQKGIKLIPKYAVGGDGKPDTTNQIGTDRKYTIPYSEAKAKELVTRCKKESSSPKFYIKDENGPTFRVRFETNFYRPFDELMQEAISGKPI